MSMTDEYPGAFGDPGILKAIDTLLAKRDFSKSVNPVFGTVPTISELASKYVKSAILNARGAVPESAVHSYDLDYYLSMCDPYYERMCRICKNQMMNDAANDAIESMAKDEAKEFTKALASIVRSREKTEGEDYYVTRERIYRLASAFTKGSKPKPEEPVDAEDAGEAESPVENADQPAPPESAGEDKTGSQPVPEMEDNNPVDGKGSDAPIKEPEAAQPVSDGAAERAEPPVDVPQTETDFTDHRRFRADLMKGELSLDNLKEYVKANIDSGNEENIQKAYATRDLALSLEWVKDDTVADPNEALSALFGRANNGDAPAMVASGYVADTLAEDMEGEERMRLMATSTEMYLKAAMDHGDKCARRKLALKLLDRTAVVGGEYYDKDDADELAYRILQSNEGDADSMYYLSVMSAQGIGCEKNEASQKISDDYFKSALDGGSELAKKFGQPDESGERIVGGEGGTVKNGIWDDYAGRNLRIRLKTAFSDADRERIFDKWVGESGMGELYQSLESNADLRSKSDPDLPPLEGVDVHMVKKMLEAMWATGASDTRSPIYDEAKRAWMNASTDDDKRTANTHARFRRAFQVGKEYVNVAGVNAKKIIKDINDVDVRTQCPLAAMILLNLLYMPTFIRSKDNSSDDWNDMAAKVDNMSDEDLNEIMAFAARDEGVKRALEAHNSGMQLADSLINVLEKYSRTSDDPFVHLFLYKINGIDYSFHPRRGLSRLWKKSFDEESASVSSMISDVHGLLSEIESRDVGRMKLFDINEILSIWRKRRNAWQKEADRIEKEMKDSPLDYDDSTLPDLGVLENNLLLIKDRIKKNEALTNENLKLIEILAGKLHVDPGEGESPAEVLDRLITIIRREKEKNLVDDLAQLKEKIKALEERKEDPALSSDADSITDQKIDEINSWDTDYVDNLTERELALAEQARRRLGRGVKREGDHDLAKLHRDRFITLADDPYYRHMVGYGLDDDSNFLYLKQVNGQEMTNDILARYYQHKNTERVNKPLRMEDWLDYVENEWYGIIDTNGDFQVLGEDNGGAMTEASKGLFVNPWASDTILPFLAYTIMASETAGYDYKIARQSISRAIDNLTSIIDMSNKDYRNACMKKAIMGTKGDVAPLIEYDEYGGPMIPKSLVLSNPNISPYLKDDIDKFEGDFFPLYTKKTTNGIKLSRLRRAGFEDDILMYKAGQILGNLTAKQASYDILYHLFDNTDATRGQDIFRMTWKYANNELSKPEAEAFISAMTEYAKGIAELQAFMKEYDRNYEVFGEHAKDLFKEKKDDEESEFHNVVVSAFAHDKTPDLEETRKAMINGLNLWEASLGGITVPRAIKKLLWPSEKPPEGEVAPGSLGYEHTHSFGDLLMDTYVGIKSAQRTMIKQFNTIVRLTPKADNDAFMYIDENGDRKIKPELVSEEEAVPKLMETGKYGSEDSARQAYRTEYLPAHKAYFAALNLQKKWVSKRKNAEKAWMSAYRKFLQGTHPADLDDLPPERRVRMCYKTLDRTIVDAFKTMDKPIFSRIQRDDSGVYQLDSAIDELAKMKPESLKDMPDSEWTKYAYTCLSNGIDIGLFTDEKIQARIDNISNNRKAVIDAYGKNGDNGKMKEEMGQFRLFDSGIEGKTFRQYYDALLDRSSMPGEESSLLAPRMMMPKSPSKRSRLPAWDKFVGALGEERARTGNQKIRRNEGPDGVTYTVMMNTGQSVDEEVVLQEDKFDPDDKTKLVSRTIYAPIKPDKDGNREVLYDFRLEPITSGSSIKVPVERFYDCSFEPDEIRSSSDTDYASDRISNGYLMGLGNYSDDNRGDVSTPCLKLIYGNGGDNPPTEYKVVGPNGNEKDIIEAIGDSIGYMDSRMRKCDVEQKREKREFYRNLIQDLSNNSAISLVRMLRRITLPFVGTTMGDAYERAGRQSTGILGDSPEAAKRLLFTDGFLFDDDQELKDILSKNMPEDQKLLAIKRHFKLIPEEDVEESE